MASRLATRLSSGVLALCAALVSAAPSPVATGRVLDPIDCTKFPGQSYALYLPKAYTPERSWPVLYVFDARQNGRQIAELHAAAAERYGWIVVSSNNSRSDEREDDPNAAAMKAMWEDSHERFTIDPRRVYATGYSGGARAAVVLALVRSGEVAGVIGHGGGFPFGIAPAKPARFAFYGLAGRRDFNYLELLRLDDTLQGLGFSHHFQSFDGPHDWATPEEIDLALRFFEARARLGSGEDDFVRGTATAFRERAEQAVGREDRIESVRILDMLERELSAGVSAAERELWRHRTAELRASPAYAAEVADVARVQAKEASRLERARVALGAFLANDPETANSVQAAGRMDIPRLRGEAAEAKDSRERESAARTLATLFGQTAFYMPRELKVKGDPRRAALLLEIATLIRPDEGGPWLNLGRMRVLAGDERGAVAALRRALELGAITATTLAEDPEYTALRQRKDFRALLEARIP